LFPVEPRMEVGGIDPVTLSRFQASGPP